MLDVQGSEVVDYVFFSRLRTAGRVLDELVGKHQQVSKAGLVALDAAGGEV